MYEHNFSLKQEGELSMTLNLTCMKKDLIKATFHVTLLYLKVSVLVD